ncbi:molecular chaperone TorD family protein [Proteus sp. WDL240414]|uniref:DmsD n=2 Tax=Proteus TaxID=583 RepID=A0A6I7D8Z0_9GAMM|nr:MULTISPECIES: molecular chaperone TorD family protein [Proteus]MBG2801927.1 molecular chaperone TorD family protein [Proteus mirabilis]MBG3020018.1 molecular chaperone TorD family protein [Proteus mirabilis]MBG3151532.1 molecular chaperone TorD family protein [Proteus mirabilis]QHN12296.1 DmsD [Proteus columbae]
MSRLSYYAAAFNLLGICYLFPPDDDTNKTALNFFKTGDFVAQWPCKIENRLCERLIDSVSIDTEQLKNQWQNLFVGPNALPAPPWGSVYLDPEGLLQGDSTLALSEFLKRERLKVNTPFPEPVDHIGLMLFQAAVLASEKREDAVNELFSLHLTTWLPHYLNKLKMSGYSQFYSTLTELVTITVNAFRK